MLINKPIFAPEKVLPLANCLKVEISFTIEVSPAGRTLSTSGISGGLFELSESGSSKAAPNIAVTTASVCCRPLRKLLARSSSCSLSEIPGDPATPSASFEIGQWISNLIGPCIVITPMRASPAAIAFA